MKISFNPDIVTSSAFLKSNQAPFSLSAKNKSLKEKGSFELFNYTSVGTIIPFCAKKKACADDVKREARKLCSNCKYGKANILDNLDKLKIKTENGKIFLEGYYTNEDDETYTGICEELAHKAGTFLQEKFKDSYTPLLVSFSERKFNFNEHVCIVMIKRSEKNDIQINGIRNLEYGKNLCDIEGYDGKALFDSAIFIDPSFNIVCDIHKMPANYTNVVVINTIEKNNPYNEPKEIILGHNNYLGYLKDICPEMQAVGFPKNAMVSFVVPEEKQGAVFRKRPVFRIYLPENKHYIEGEIKDLKKLLPHSKFSAFMIKLDDELKRNGI